MRGLEPKLAGAALDVVGSDAAPTPKIPEVFVEVRNLNPADTRAPVHVSVTFSR